MQMYSIFDHKTGEYEYPMGYLSEALVRRAIASLLLETSPGSILRQFPGDFSLYLLGTYDRQGAVFHLLPTPQLVCNIVDLMPVVPQRTESEEHHG